jgi:LemA protein
MTTLNVIIAVAAVLGFWIVGAYNRLVALRNVISTAWSTVDEHLRRRGELVLALMGVLDTRMPEERITLESIAGAVRQVQAAADTLRARPLDADGAASFGAAEGVFGVAIARLRSLLDTQPELRAEPAIDVALREQEAVDLRLMLARQTFNDAVDAYNAASRQFPSVLVARIFGLRQAGRI